MSMLPFLQVCVNFPNKELIDGGELTGAKNRGYSTAHATAHADGASAMTFVRYCLNCKSSR